MIEYLAHKVQYADFAASDIREDFGANIDPYIALELSVGWSVREIHAADDSLTAADYLDI